MSITNDILDTIHEFVAETGARPSRVAVSESVWKELKAELEAAGVITQMSVEAQLSNTFHGLPVDICPEIGPFFAWGIYP